MVLEFPIFIEGSNKVVNLTPYEVAVLRNSPGEEKQLLGRIPACDTRLSPYSFKEEDSYFDRSEMEHVKTVKHSMRCPPRADKFCSDSKVTTILVEEDIYDLLRSSAHQYTWSEKATPPQVAITILKDRAKAGSRFIFINS